MKRLYAWLATFVMFAGPAFAADCRPWDVIVEGAKQVPVFSAPRVLKGSGLELAIHIFNSFPPENESGYTFAAIIDIADEAGGGGLLLVGPPGQICGAVRIDKEHWEALKRAVEGQVS